MRSCCTQGPVVEPIHLRIYVVCTDAGSDEASAFRIAKQELFSDASQPNVILISTFCFMHQIHLGVKKASR